MLARVHDGIKDIIEIIQLNLFGSVYTSGTRRITPFTPRLEVVSQFKT